MNDPVEGALVGYEHVLEGLEVRQVGCVEMWIETVALTNDQVKVP